MRHDKCSKVKTTKERRTILAQKNKCFNCLRSGHTRYQCRSKGRCLHCRQKHHTSICEPSEPNRDSSKKHENQEDPQNNNIVTSTMTTMASTTTHTNTLMQTALVTASGPTTRCQARTLIDTGSQKTFHYAMPEEYVTVESSSERNTRLNHIWFNQRNSKILGSRNT